MYQNFNCCSSDWMERTKYIQGRSGAKSKDCLPFVQYYKCLENKTENENIQYLHYAQLFPAHITLGNSCQYPIILPHSLPRPQNSFLFSEDFCPRPSQQSCCLPYCNILTIFSSFTPYRVLCHHLQHGAGKRAESPLKIKNDLETKMYWRYFSAALHSRRREPYCAVTPSSLAGALCCSQWTFFVSPSEKLHEAQLHSRI